MKLLKRILLIGLALCLVLGLAAACVDNEDPNPETVTYTVEVEIAGDDSDSALVLSLLKVQLKKDGTVAAEKELTSGKAVFELEAGTYTAEVVGKIDGAETSPLDNYDVSGNGNIMTAGSPSTKITLTKKGSSGPEKEFISYTVTVLKPDESPVEGITVQLCGGPDNTCLEEKTDAAGKAVLSREPGEYEVHIEANQIPEGFTFDNTRYRVSAAENEITVYLEAVVPVETMTFTVTLNFQDGEAIPNVKVALHHQWYDEDGYEHVDDTAAATATTDATGKATLEAPANVYRVRLLDTPATWAFGDTFIVETAAPDITISVGIRGTGLYNRIEVGEGTYTVEIPAGQGVAGIYYGFVPTIGKGGYYEVTSESNGVEVDAYRYAGTSFYINSTAEDQDVADGDFTLRFLITDEECAEGHANVWAFRFTASTDNACSFKVTFKFAEEYVAPTQETLHPNAEETLTAEELANYPQPADTTWTWLTYEDTVVKDEDGIYHYGTVTGPVIFAAVGSKVPQGMDATFSTAIPQDIGAIVWSTGIPDENNVITFYDMTEFFGQYAAAANAEGVHPLTEELKLALQHYASSHGIYATLEWPRESDGLFAFACGYYKSDYEEAVGGTGTAEDAYVIRAFGKYRATIAADGTVYYLVRNAAGTITFDDTNVVCTFNGTDYAAGTPVTFEADTNGAIFTFKGKDGAAVTFTFTLAAKLGTEENPLVLTAEAPLTVHAAAGEDVYVRFTPSETNLYTLTADNAAAIVSSTIGLFETIEGEGTVTIELVGGTAYLFTCSGAEGAEVTFNLTLGRGTYVSPTGSGADFDSAKQLRDEGWYLVTTDAQGTGAYFTFTTMTAGKYRIRITNPIASILYYGNDRESEGTVYTLGSEETALNIDFEAEERSIYYFYMGAAEETAAEYFFHFGPAPAEGENPPVVVGSDLNVGANEVHANGDGVQLTFIAPADGTYVFTLTDPNASIFVEDATGGEIVCDGGSVGAPNAYEVTLKAGERFTALYLSNDWTETTYTLTISMKEGTGSGSGSGSGMTGSGTDSDPYVLQSIEGAYSVTVQNDGMFAVPVYYTFKATESATYTMTTDFASIMFQVYYLDESGEFPIQTDAIFIEGDRKTGDFTLTAGVTYTIVVSDWNDVGGAISFTIAKK